MAQGDTKSDINRDAILKADRANIKGKLLVC